MHPLGDLKADLLSIYILENLHGGFNKINGEML